jgi:hypothetical protein
MTTNITCDVCQGEVLPLERSTLSVRSGSGLDLCWTCTLRMLGGFPELDTAVRARALANGWPLD